MKLLNVITTVALVAALIALLPVARIPFWPIEVAANLQGYLLACHLCLLAIYSAFILSRGTGFVYLLALLGAIALIFSGIASFYYPHSMFHRIRNEHCLKLLFANVYIGSKSSKALNEILESKWPDIVAFVELSRSMSGSLELKKEYPYSLESHAGMEYGVGIFSRFPLQERGRVEPAMKGAAPFLIAEIKWPEAPFVFALVHTVPPRSNQDLAGNIAMLNELQAKLSAGNLPYAVAGDFNATPFSTIYRDFVSKARLINVFQGRGIRKTWNAKKPYLILMLDHILLHELVPSEPAVLSYIGSDHFPLYSEVCAPAIRFEPS